MPAGITQCMRATKQAGQRQQGVIEYKVTIKVGGPVKFEC